MCLSNNPQVNLAKDVTWISLKRQKIRSKDQSGNHCSYKILYIISDEPIEYFEFNQLPNTFSDISDNDDFKWINLIDFN